MFTIKYRFFVLADQQPQEGPKHYDQCESCHGPFEVVSQERRRGFIVVHGIDPAGQPMTFGPHQIDSLEAAAAGDLESQAPRPTVWVMNEAGATVAKYDL
jgi:hypothetical protein